MVTRLQWHHLLSYYPKIGTWVDFCPGILYCLTLPVPSFSYPHLIQRGEGSPGPPPAISKPLQL